MHTAGIKQHIKGARNSANPSAAERQSALRFISMEKSTDKLNKENRSTAPGIPQAEKDSPVLAAEGAAGMSRVGSLVDDAADVKSLGFAEECLKEMEKPSCTKQDSPDAFKSAVLDRDCADSKPRAMLMNKTSPEAHWFEMCHQGSPTTPIDMDCLVCFNKYNVYRAPKLLECQHAFCAICLKLILRKEESAWIITCPLCRKTTSVSGGLIRTLQNKEDIMEHLENPDSNPEVHISATGLDSSSWTQSNQDTLHRDENVPADNRLAVQRLALLLLLVVILTIIILPFTYSGLAKWVICLMLMLGLALSVVLCCTPRFCWRCNSDSHKETHITAIA